VTRDGRAGVHGQVVCLLSGLKRFQVCRVAGVRLVGCQIAGVAADFAGSTARCYAVYRRDAPGFLLDAGAIAARISSADWVLDLACGTGQVAPVLSSRVGGVLAIDPSQTCTAAFVPG
jgi:hypothetical protein